MGFQSKTYSLSDEVVAAIEAARSQGETPNRFLRRMLLGKPIVTQKIETDYTTDADPVVRLDATGPELSSGRGKATTETRGPRPKGDKTR